MKAVDLHKIMQDIVDPGRGRRFSPKEPYDTVRVCTNRVPTRIQFCIINFIYNDWRGLGIYFG